MILFNIVVAILFLSVIIVAHELGHMLSAKALGIRVLEFAVGMGPAILKKQGKETLYTIRAVPIGGFCKFEGEDGEKEDVVYDSRSFFTQPRWKRGIVLAMGSVANFILAILISSILVAAEPIASNVVAVFDDGAVTNGYGLMVGDEIVEINGKKVNVAMDVIYILIDEGALPVSVEVIRDGETVTLRDVQFPVVEDSGLLIGTIDFKFLRANKTPVLMIKQAFYKCVSVTRAIWASLAGLVTGKYGANDLSGPVGITQTIGEAARSGFFSLITLMMFISINLGIMNLLPLPALDGGRIVFLGIEAIRGKPINPKIEGIINVAGFALLIMLMIFVTFNDIYKIFAGG